MKGVLRRLAVVLVIGAALVGCAAAGASSSPTDTSTPVPAATERPQLTIYGAASLTGLLEAAKSAYEQTIGADVSIVISTDSSAALATKIQEGAPADLFLSADTANPRKLAEAGLVVGDAVSFAANELTIIVPTDDPAGIRSPRDLARDGVRIIAAGDEVPISVYVAQLVAQLGDRDGYPTDFAEAYATNVLSKEENVKAVVAKIELGEGDAGIVYVTDALASTNVETVHIPAGSNVRATYAAVVLSASAHQAEAQAFLDWLQGAEGLAILQGFGFLPPPE